MGSENKVTCWLKLGFKIWGWIAAALGLIASLIILFGGGTPGAPRITSLLALVLGLLYAMFFYLIAEVLRLLMQIECNTSKRSSDAMPD